TAGAGATRNFVVADAATGNDLVITSAITDGTGLQSSGITKSGLGTMEFQGSTANTYTGTTLVNDGQLNLNKTGGNAIGGALTIGDGALSGNGSTGFGSSDVVQLKQSNQIPDFQAAVQINTTGQLDLNGNSDVI